MDELGDGISVLSVENCRAKQLLPGKFSETLVGLTPSFHRARDGYAMNPILWHGRNPLLLEKISRQAARRPSAGIQAVKFPALGFPINEEEIAADSVHHGLSDAEHRIGRDSRINRRSAARQNLCARLRRENVTGGDDPAIADDHGATVGTFLGGQRHGIDY